ncbi:P2X purinoceptor [Pimephales promelas]|nr:P2X purinoceptor [Pimephales promelas]
MENLEDFEQMEEEFEFDGRPYLFEPEYTDEELASQESERRRQTAEQPADEANASTTRISCNWWCLCGCCDPMPTEEESLCCKEWDLLQPGNEKCVTCTEEFPALIQKTVLDTFFFVPKINWKKRPQPEGPNGQLSIDQYRLVAYRVVLEWALKGERLGRGIRRPLPSCVVSMIRRKYPSPTGTYIGFQETEEIC